MKVKHAWKQTAGQKAGPVTMVPIRQVEAAVTLASHNTAAFTIQMIQEQMLLMLSEEFGFGRKRCMRALRAIQRRMAQWEQDVNQEFDAETFHMTFKERRDHRSDLDWTWKKHDEALRPLVDPEIFRPYTERYKGFGGTGSWCR